MQTTILIIHTLIAIAIIALVLLQRGKGAEAGAGFGAGASGTVFGARGSTSFFSRTTALLATAFFITSLTLAYISSQRSDAPESLIENVTAVPVEEPTPENTPAVDAVPEMPQGADDAAPASEDMAPGSQDMAPASEDVPPALEDAAATTENEPEPQE